MNVLRNWLPAYLFYSGVLAHFLVAAYIFAHLLTPSRQKAVEELRQRVSARLAEPEFCQSLFANNAFNWSGEESFEFPLEPGRPAKLVYRSIAAVGQTAANHYIYKVDYQIEHAGKKIRTDVSPMLEVDRSNRIVTCHYSLMDWSNPPRAETRSVACEKPGWTRKFLCDPGTDRCKPLSFCRQESGDRP